MVRRLFNLLLLCFLMSSALLAQFGPSAQPGVKLSGRNYADLFAAQRILLSNYCRLDFEGARLQPNGWARVKPFSTLKSNPDYMRVMIVTRYDIDTPEQATDVLTVKYQVIGFFQLGEGYTPQSGVDRAAFHVQEERGELLITEIKPDSPYVSARAAMAWLNAKIADAKTSDVERGQMQSALAQLQKQTAPRTPAAQQ